MKKKDLAKNFQNELDRMSDEELNIILKKVEPYHNCEGIAHLWVQDIDRFLKEQK